MSLENSLQVARVKDGLVGPELNFQGGDSDKDVISGRMKFLNQDVARGKVSSRYGRTGRSLICLLN